MTIRRRGKALEQAIFAAVLSQLSESGYGALTYEGVAAAASTSKAVLYRRWPSRSQMVLAALEDYWVDRTLEVSDSGSLAGDIRAMLRGIRDMFSRHHQGTLLGVLAELEPSSAETMRAFLFTRNSQLLQPILDRARRRGELGRSSLPMRVLSLPFDLLRHEVLIVGKATDDVIDEFVDDCVVPLFVGFSGNRAKVNLRLER